MQRLFVALNTARLSWVGAVGVPLTRDVPPAVQLTVCLYVMVCAVQPEPADLFTRLWIYSHHIYSKVKRRDMLELARDCAVTGFSLPGKPGIICVEGPAASTADWWKRVSPRTPSGFTCQTSFLWLSVFFFVTSPLGNSIILLHAPEEKLEK